MAQDTFFSPKPKLLLQGKEYYLDQPAIMGILNVSPDSFYDGGKYETEKTVLVQTEKLLAEGANFIDIGGVSSRPGAQKVSEEEERKRVIPFLKMILKKFPNVLISADTFRNKIANEALNEGAVMINDISGGRCEPEILKTIASFQCTAVIMHNRNNFENMHDKSFYKDIIKEAKKELAENCNEAVKSGIKSILIDPGFGFAKNTEQNFEILNKLDELSSINNPILAGISRKSMIWKTLDTTPENALNGTTALHMIALDKGAKVLRVHDVKEAKECITLFNKLKSNGKEG